MKDNNIFILVTFLFHACVAGTIILYCMRKRDAFYRKALYYRLFKQKERHRPLLDLCIKKIEFLPLYKKAGEEIKKAGYAGKYHPFWYVTLLYILPVALAFLGFILNPADRTKAFLGSLALSVYVRTIVVGKKKNLTKKFEKHAWRIYRYLHYQIASGIKITDAVTTVYETVDDATLKSILIKFAATFQLTMNIETALEEMTSRFGGNEASTLCMALREGVKTGDSEVMLKRQEDVMFNKYFNRLEAETEKSRTICVLSAAMFCAILVIMASVPIIMDLKDALSGIFIT